MSDPGSVEIAGIDLDNTHFPAMAQMGGKKIVVLRLATGYRAVAARCPHQFAPMTKAVVTGNGTLIRCPLHNFIFRLSDGTPVNCPTYRLEVFDIREIDGRFWGHAVTPAAPSDRDAAQQVVRIEPGA